MSCSALSQKPNTGYRQNRVSLPAYSIEISRKSTETTCSCQQGFRNGGHMVNMGTHERCLLGPSGKSNSSPVSQLYGNQVSIVSETHAAALSGSGNRDNYTNKMEWRPSQELGQLHLVATFTNLNAKQYQNTLSATSHDRRDQHDHRNTSPETKIQLRQKTW